MGKMDSSKSKRRRRMESQTSNTSNLTQTTQLSFDSCGTPDSSVTVVKSPARVPRKRTVSENPAVRPHSLDWDADDDRNKPVFSLESFPTSPTGQNQFSAGQSQPRYGRRNTENSVNTQQLRNCPSLNADDFHRSNTTSCIHGHAMQHMGHGYPQLPTSPCGDCQQYQHQVAYDNAGGTPWHPAPLSPQHRSRSASTVENNYISLDPPFNNNYIRPVAGTSRQVDTAVVLQGNGKPQTVPNIGAGHHRKSFDNLDSVESGTPRSEQSSGYCTNATNIGRHVCGCFHVDQVEFYKNGFYVLMAINVLVLLTCVVGLPVAYFLSIQQETPLPSTLPIVSSSKTKETETCRPATELIGNLVEGKDVIVWEFPENRKDCGFALSPDRTSIEINETRKYFIYSRIDFRIEQKGNRTQYPVGHRLLVNDSVADYVSQTCSAGPEMLLHLSVLQTTRRLTKGHKISIQIKAPESSFVSGNRHRLGIIAI